MSKQNENLYIRELSVSYRKRRMTKAEQKYVGKRFTNSKMIYLIFEDFGKECVEKFWVAHLDNKNRVRAIQFVSVGSLTAAIVHPREIFKAALVANSAAVVFLHNHPSGDPSPSPDDIEITKRLKEASIVIGINVIDHIIIGDGEYVSLRDDGLL